MIALTMEKIAIIQSVKGSNAIEGIITTDERIKEIKPEQKDSEPTLDANNILIIDPKIKDIAPKNSRISFKKPTIIIPVIAFIFVSILGMYLFVSN